MLSLRHVTWQKQNSIMAKTKRKSRSSSNSLRSIAETVQRSLSANYTIWTIVLVFLIVVDSAALAKKLNASQAFDNTWSTATDLENELEQKRSAKSVPSPLTSSSSGSSSSGSSSSNSYSGSGGWTAWSEWSTCSRTCDGGVMQQMRRCQNANGCKGDSVRYRICNMQPCPEKLDFRAQQCAANNDVPYDGTLYKWTPHYDYVEPCALTCRGRPAHLTDDISPEATADDSEHYDELSVVVQLSPRVLDGTRCRSGSLDMCIQGKCQRVGCDLKIGSAKKVDSCGVCGGDGSSCSQTHYQWEIAPMSLCSVSCGGGYKMSRIVCRSRVTGAEVEDAFCNVANRPEPSVELCNTHTCPARWIADDWSPCSRLCGPGVRERMIVCAEENNGIKTRVADIMCPLPKPPTQEQCIMEECPKWEAEEWTGFAKMFGSKIIKPGGAEPDDFEKSIAQALVELEANGDLKPYLRDLHITRAREIEFGNKKAVIIYVPIPQQETFQKIQIILVRELEKKFSGKRVVVIGKRKARKARNPLREKRPRSRTLTSVHDAILEDLVSPAEIVGKRIRVQLDGFQLIKVHLDKNQQTIIEHKVDTFTSVYNKLIGRDEFPDSLFDHCSVSCGQGIQMRGVECKSPDGRLSAKCDPLTKPSSMQQCTTVISCDGGSMSGGGKIIVGSSGPNNPMDDEEDLDEEEDEDDEDSEDLDDDNVSSDDASYNDQPLVYSHHTVSRLHQDESGGPKTMRLTSGSYSSRDSEPSEPTYIKDLDWSPCSVTCGEGIRRRTHKCKIFLEYSRTLATVNDSLCEGFKPHDEVERCVEEPCMLPSHGYEDQYPRDSIKVGVSEPGKTYVWREQGYTSCSASCLGGVEELIINCVREDNGRVVSPFLCAPETKPEARVRTCNDRPCPPRWNYSDYTPCSKSCGIGIKTREVQCIHEVTRGGENTMVVPNSMCPQPPPADRQYCNVLDCPVRWDVGEWSKCSHTCGYGFKERKVECKQIMAQEHKIERPESMCPSSKPPDKKPCNVKPCPPEDPKPVIQISNTTHIQHDPKKSKITLKVGGAGVVFFGTQVKIKCPVKRYNRTKIKWSKDHKPLVKSRKFKVSKKGALRILDITFRDAGVYSCHAGLSSAEITIDVKAKPGQKQEELERHESDRLVRERSDTEPLTAADMTATDNSTQTIRRKQQQQQQQQQNARERNRRPKSDGVQQHADSSIMGDEHSHLVQQAQDSLQQQSVSSGSSRTNALLAMPYFQALLNNLQYLWPSFQKFSHSRGHHMLADNSFQYGIDFNRPHPEEQAAKPPAQSATQDFTSPPAKLNSFNYISNDVADEDKDKELGDMTVAQTEVVLNTNDAGDDSEVDEEQSTLHLPHARWPNNWSDVGAQLSESSRSVTYKWLTSPWSACSQKCDAAGSGLRRRTVTCVRINLGNNRLNQPKPPAQQGDESYTQISEGSPLLLHDDDNQEIVDNAVCEDYGLDIPDTFEACGTEECPRWTKGEWSACHQSRCFGRNTAIQKREVSCRFANDSIATTCPEYEKPISRQECYNERCRGVWRVEPWSECNAPCGRQGIKYRVLQCVWYGTRRPAGNACKHQNRPAIMKVCKSPSCFAKALQQCKDTSRYCRNVRSMGLCRLHRYQVKCCKSCKYNNIPN